MTATAARTPAASAIVLAGGRSRRFGSDKLAVPLQDGRSVLAHTLAAVASVAAEVVVVLASGGALPADAGSAATIVRDPEAYSGPLVGLVAGLAAATHRLVLVVGGDMPAIEPAVLRLILEALHGDPAAGVARLEAEAADDVDARGARTGGAGGPPLPCAVRRDVALVAGRETIAAGDRRLRGCLERLRPVVVPARTWRAADPRGRTLLDIDDPSDVERLRAPD